MHQRFRTIGIAEGISFLLLLGVAMPLKYVYGQPLGVKFVGWIHGMLFIAYFYHATQLSQTEKWPVKKLVAACFAAVLPFGTFVFDWKYLRTRQG